MAALSVQSWIGAYSMSMGKASRSWRRNSWLAATPPAMTTEAGWKLS